MLLPDDGRGNLYEQVLEYAKREMDEATSKVEDIKQSLQLLEARVEAAKAVYQAVASRLNLEDESDGAGLGESFPEVPTPAPEPPPAAEISAPESSVAAPADPQRSSESLENGAPQAAQVAVSAPEEVSAAPKSLEPAPSADTMQPTSAGPDASDLDIIRQHLAAKAERESGAPGVQPTPEPAPAAFEAAVDSEAAGDDSFSMQLIRQHLENKAKEQASADASPPVAPSPELTASVADAAAPEPVTAPKSKEGAGGGLSEADRELIDLRSKQN
ncbi:TPA: hypothetical protein DCE37_19985 [Candidatus Latescibacteria bacterium]|nr:hypothetical protein [Candidatus Latescibacterota bacterium]